MAVAEAETAILTALVTAHMISKEVDTRFFFFFFFFLGGGGGGGGGGGWGLQKCVRKYAPISHKV